jgi:hypothetical protein
MDVDVRHAMAHAHAHPTWMWMCDMPMPTHMHIDIRIHIHAFIQIQIHIHNKQNAEAADCAIWRENSWPRDRSMGSIDGLLASSGDRKQKRTGGQIRGDGALDSFPRRCKILESIQMPPLAPMPLQKKPVASFRSLAIGEGIVCRHLEEITLHRLTCLPNVVP